MPVGKGTFDGSVLHPLLQVLYVSIGMSLAVFDGNQNSWEYFIYSLSLGNFYFFWHIKFKSNIFAPERSIIILSKELGC